MDILRSAIMIDDANKSLRSLFKEQYDEMAQKPRMVLRNIMEELHTDNPLKALTVALQRVIDTQGEFSQTAQVHSVWFCAAAADLCKEK